MHTVRGDAALSSKGLTKGGAEFSGRSSLVKRASPDPPDHGVTNDDSKLQVVQVDGKSSSTVSPRTVQRMTLETSDKRNTAAFRRVQPVRRSETLVVQDGDPLIDQRTLADADTTGDVVEQLESGGCNIPARRSIKRESMADVARHSRRPSEVENQEMQQASEQATNRLSTRRTKENQQLEGYSMSIAFQTSQQRARRAEARTAGNSLVRRDRAYLQPKSCSISEEPTPEYITHDNRDAKTTMPMATRSFKPKMHGNLPAGLDLNLY